MIQPSVIEDIKYRNDIEDVISQYVALTKAGSNLKGLCPFHSEKTPSFTVFPSSKSFYCFGCNVGGDVISFVMRAENLEYVGALELLAKRAGIDIPESDYSDDTVSANRVKRSRIYEINTVAARFFHEQLKVSSAALNYIKKRELSSSAVKHFGIGYAPNSFTALHDHMSKLGYSDEELAAAGVCGVSERTGRAFDIFRNRLIFPVIDVSGNIIGFGGRTLDSSDPKKYINTNETPAFKKGRNLFALNFAKSHCKDELILCEGYMDVVSLHAAGIENAVASLGTALTSDQARLMKKYTSRAVISYDSDEAGQRNAKRAITILREVGLDVKVLSLGDVKDPDDYIKKYGVDSFRQRLGQSKTEFEYKYEGVISKYDINVLEGKIKAMSEIVGIIADVPSAVERDMYILKVSSDLQTDKESIRSDVERIRRSRRKKENKDSSRRIMLEAEGYGDRVNPDRIKNLKAVSTEEVILGILLIRPELIGSVKSGKIDLASADFESEFNKRVFEKMIEISDPGSFDIGIFNESFTPDEVSRIVKIMVVREDLQNSDAVLKESIATLKRSKEDKNLDLADLLEKKRKENGGN